MARIFLMRAAAALAAALVVSASPAATAVTKRGSLTFDNVPEAPAALREKLDAYLGARQATTHGFSPKGQLLIGTRFGDVEQLHLVDQPGGERRQITFLREPINEAAFSPDPARSAYVYLKDVGGNENDQLYYQRLGEPAAKCLTDGKSVNGSPVWSNAGREVAFSTTARDGVSHDIDIVDPAGGSLPRLMVTGDSASWEALDWSPDDRKLLVLKTVSISESYLYVVDLDTGQKREVDPAPGKVGIVGARFSRDGQGVYLISDRDGEFAQLRYVGLFNAEKTLISGKNPWDVEELAVSRDGHYLAYVSNEAGAGKLNLLDLRTHQDLIPPRLPTAGLVQSLSFDSTASRLAFSFAAPNRPRDAYVLNLTSNQLEEWTHSEAGAVDLGKFVIPRLVEFPTFDRTDGRARTEAAYVYEPAAAGKHPVLLLLHGGPESQFRPGFDPWIEFVVNELGYVVVAPNVRGSSGYGKTYLSLDNGVLREDAVKDVGALLVWIGLQSSMDSKRVVVSGGSYGGYLSLASLVEFSDRLRGGIDVAGFTDFVSFLTNTAPYRRDLRRAEYGDERDPDTRAFLRRISPLTNAERIKRPLLVVQGRNDPRVPLSEAEQLVNRLRAKGSTVWYLVADDEGHGFRKKQNRDAYFETMAQFLASMSGD
ncbi:MAG TPA: alpha/beta fold hydrolase [Steroidobacteraceae bacterium]|jgi:dipeptidyl aminopeptidase/acylaminoacyl peptidase|nr:alpha/beta fold hydrolase [Steroidobacteraceae bacterium]